MFFLPRRSLYVAVAVALVRSRIIWATNSLREGDACERLGCLDPAPPSIALGTTYFEIVFQPARTFILSGDAGDVQHVIGKSTTPEGFPGATLEAFRVQGGKTTATFVTSHETIFLIPTPHIGATASWGIVSNTVTHTAGPDFSVILATPSLTHGVITFEPTTTKTSVVTITKTFTSTSTHEDVRTVVEVLTQQPRTTTEFVTLDPSTVTSITTSTSTTTRPVSYCPPPPPSPSPICKGSEVVVPWTATNVPVGHAEHSHPAPAGTTSPRGIAYATIPLGFPYKTLLRVLDAGYRAEFYAVSVDNGEDGEGELLGHTSTHPLHEEELVHGIHTHCGARGDEDTANQCTSLGFSEGSFVVPADTQAVRVTMAYSARHDDYSTVLYTLSSFCD